MQLPHSAYAAAPARPALAQTSAAGVKRSRDDKENENPNDLTPACVYEAMYSSEDDGGRPIKWNCNQIRTKINTLIRSGEIKVTHFQKEIGVSSNAYTRFMKSKGPDGGMFSNTYDGAHRYFEKREAKGIKMPPAKR